MTRKDLTKYIAENAIIAALYFLLTLVLPSYESIQFRLSEILVLLCFWRPDLIIGVTLGCLCSNFMSPLGLTDIIFGTLATFVSSFLIAYASPRLWVATIYPIAVNAVVVGAEIYYVENAPFWLTAGSVAIGEATVILVSYILWMGLSRNRGFMKALAPTRHQEIRI
jgi:uncharacterized membrane protein